ncbi:hypothetical protein ABPG75_011617 [Micractinium tetrahymenae]
MQPILLFRFHTTPPEALDLLVSPLREAFGLPVRPVAQPIKLTARGHYPERGQWLARALLQQVAAAPGEAPAEGVLQQAQRQHGAAARLAVVDQDLFATGKACLNFVFGEANASQQCAVMSIARLDDAFYGLPPTSPGAFQARCATEAVHELGHVFGLPHCRSRRCVMWFSNTLEETDAKGLMEI